MMLVEEYNELRKEIEKDPEVLAFQQDLENQHKSWFRLKILDPILKPIIEKILREYGELILRKALEVLINKKKS